MEKKTVLVLMLQPLFMGMLTLALDIQPVRADWSLTEIVFIMADGSVVPDTAPISSVDNITYTLTDNIVDQANAMYTIVIQRENIVFDGAGYTLQGNDTGMGIKSFGTVNVTVKNVQIKGYGTGINFDRGSHYTTISGNTITDCGDAVWAGSSGLTISGNNITNSGWRGIYLGAYDFINVSRNYIAHNTLGIALLSGSNYHYILENTIVNNTGGISMGTTTNNTICHNNFIDNDEQVSSNGYDISRNVWDDGYPSGGNYWSDYLGGDVKSGSYQNVTGSDGIGDTPYNITASTTDSFPLMGPFNSFTAGTWNEVTYFVQTVSNSTVSDFNFSQPDMQISYNATGLDGTTGFSRVTIPKELLWVENGWVILVDGEPAVPTVTEDAEHTYLYFTYSHSKKTVEIQGTNAIPEFTTWTAILLVLVAFTVAIAIHKQRLLKPPIH